MRNRWRRRSPSLRRRVGRDLLFLLERVAGRAEADPDLGDLPLPVTAQLLKNDTGLCLEGQYDTGDVIKNDAGQFKAKAQ